MIENKVKIYRNVKILNTCYGNNVVIGEDSFVDSTYLGDFVRINRRNFILNATIDNYSYTGCNTIIKHTVIGKFCAISWNVSIGGGDHNYQHISTYPFDTLLEFETLGGKNELYKSTLRIGNDVWIGSGCNILRNVKVGDGAVIGAGSIVTKDIPPYAIAYGVPAKVIKFRFSKNIIEKLLQLKWWDWNKEQILANKHLFNNKLTEKSFKNIKF